MRGQTGGTRQEGGEVGNAGKRESKSMREPELERAREGEGENRERNLDRLDDRKIYNAKSER